MKYFLAFIITLAVLTYPLSVIFAINTLFVSLSIPYTFWTWLSVVILSTLFYGKK